MAVDYLLKLCVRYLPNTDAHVCAHGDAVLVVRREVTIPDPALTTGQDVILTVRLELFMLAIVLPYFARAV